MTQEIIQRAKITEGQEIFFPCFTPEIPQRTRNNPVIRFGRISLISTEEYETEEGNVRFHLAECFPFGGNSGSPVFIRSRRSPTEEVYSLIGIMTGHYITERPVVRQTQSGLMTQQHMGIAMILPADYLLDILNSDTLRRRRGEVS